MKQILILLTIFLTPLFCGCFDQQIFENTAIIIYAGAEMTEESDSGELLFSIAAAESEGKDGSLLILTEKDELLESAISTMNENSSNPLRSGKIQNILFSEELAKKGISTVSDANHPETTNRFLADYAVVEGSPKEMLHVIETLEKKNEAYGYLEELLNNASNAGLCPNTLHQEFDIYFHTEGIDPVLPILSYDKEKETVKVEGTALFKGDRYVGRLTTAESRYLSLMTTSADIISVKIKDINDEGRDLTLNIIEKSDRSHVDIIDGCLYITIDIDTRAYFTVSDWAEIAKSSRSEINKEIEKKLAHRCEEVFRIMQNCGCDPLGIKAKVRGHYNDYYHSHDMDEAYRNAVVKCRINNTLVNQKD